MMVTTQMAKAGEKKYLKEARNFDAEAGSRISSAKDFLFNHCYTEEHRSIPTGNGMTPLFQPLSESFPELVDTLLSTGMERMCLPSKIQAKAVLVHKSGPLQPSGSCSDSP